MWLPNLENKFITQPNNNRTAKLKHQVKAMIQEFKIKIQLLVSCLIRIWDNFSRRVSINPQNRMGKIMQVTFKVMGANSRRISKGSFKGREGFHPQINMEPLGIHLLNMEAPRTL